MDIMQDLDDFITSDTTEQEIVDFIKQVNQRPENLLLLFIYFPAQICHTLGQVIPNFEATCNFIVTSQLPAIIDAFVHDNMDPTQVTFKSFHNIKYFLSIY